MGLKSELPGCQCRSPGMVGLYPSAGDDAITTLLQGISQKKLQLTDLNNTIIIYTSGRSREIKIVGHILTAVK